MWYDMWGCRTFVVLLCLLDYASSSSGSSGFSISALRDLWQPYTVDLPISKVRGTGSETVSVLVLPLPVPVPMTVRDNTSNGCKAEPNKQNEEFSIDVRASNRPGTSTKERSSLNDDDVALSFNNQASSERLANRVSKKPSRTRKPTRPVQSKAELPSEAFKDQPTIAPEVSLPVSSQHLVELFRAQSPSAPHLPPAVLQQYGDLESIQPLSNAAKETIVEHSKQSYRRGRLLPPSLTQAAQGFVSFQASGSIPSLPRFDRSLMLRGELTVHNSDYTEPYTAWWNASTGVSRMDFHGGATSVFHMVQPDGLLKQMEMRVDRAGGRPVLRCGVTRPHSPPVRQHSHPALPDIGLFNFAGFVEADIGQVERWQHAITGGPGQLGAAKGEELTFHHELLLSRGADDFAVPIKYSVSVDSSVLGPASDGYEHRYQVVPAEAPAPHELQPDEGACEEMDHLDAARPEHLARLDPLREFTLPHRDLRYDFELEQFKKQFGHNYVDSIEEAVRKNLFVQHSRFINSGNREGGPFELGVNFLCDRLDAELETLLGVTADAEGFEAEEFPHSKDNVNSLANKLPKEFDWRPKGAVTPVRYQGSCASCWAFAVTGAVEGALFVRTRRLVPLSEQCLVDCAQPYGGNGCKGTWPSHAYDYIQDRGLPALEEYTAYNEKVGQCIESSVQPVTHIRAHVNVTQNSVPALKVAIRRHAPTVVVIDAKAKSFVFYKQGVLYDDRCIKSPVGKLNHAVLAVGWGESNGEPHFILKNSWSTAWGEEGYVRVQAPANTCGVLTVPSYPHLERENVDRIPSSAGTANSTDDDDAADDDEVE